MLERQHQAAREVQVTPAEEPLALLAEKARKIFADFPGWPGPAFDQVVQVRVPIGDLDPFQWLSEQTQEVKLFWESRDDEFMSAAVGVADEVLETKRPSFTNLRRVLHDRLKPAVETIRYYGGMRFDGNRAGQAAWSTFGTYRFILPRFEIREQGRQMALCCNLVFPRDYEIRDRLLQEMEDLNLSGNTLTGNCPLPVSRRDSPHEERWHEIIRDTLLMIRNGHPLEKVVLARKVEFSFAETFDKFLLFKLLRNATPDCFHFYVQLGKDQAFLGASPESLYGRRGQSIVSEAVAGTGRRGRVNALDIELGHALLLSDKDQREHAFVRKGIERVFGAICTSMRMDKTPTLMNLNIGRHLRSRISGMLRHSVSDIDILEHLPPTSAVGGHPRNEAMDIIRQLESFDRGWYAGPVGWMSKNAAEFAVAIRSGLATDDTLTLYSGAGIVDGSDPDAEWDEIEQKLGDFIKALGLDQKGAKY